MAYTYEDVITALRNADAAGDTEAATRLAGIADKLRQERGGPTVSRSSNPAQYVPLSSDQGFGDYLIDRAKQGVYENIVAPLSRAPAGVSLISDEGAVTSTPQQIEKVKQNFYRNTGTQNLAPADWIQRYAGAGVGALTDPLNYLTGGGVVRNLFGGFFGGVGGEIGGDIGKEVGGETGQLAGSVLGGAATGAAGAYAGSGPLATLVRRAGPPVRRLLRPSTVTAEIDREAEGKVRELFDAAIKADPTVATKLNEAVLQYRTLNPNAELPPLSVLIQNPIIDGKLKQLANDNGAFNIVYNKQMEDVRNRLSEQQKKLFGDPMAANERLSMAQPSFEGMRPDEKAVARRKKAIDAEIARLGKASNLDPEEVSKRAVELSEKKENLARAAAKPKYDTAISGANQRGTVFSGNDVADLYNFVVRAQARDIFFRLPQPAGRTLSVWEPEEVVDAVTGKTTLRFKKASPEDIDSLKQAINLGFRSFKDSKDRQFLVQLRQKLDEVTDRVDPQFKSDLQAADDFYRSEVGIPYNTTTLNKMDRVQYDEQVAPVITKNPQALREFLGSTGDQGLRIAEDALVTELMKKASSNGVIDTTKARNWLEKNKRLVEMVPDFEAKYFGEQGTVPKMVELENAKKRLDAQLRAGRKQKIIEAEGKSVPQLLNELRANPGKVDRFLNTYGKDKDTIDALRSFALDDILSSKDPLSVLRSKENAPLYARLFGNTYMPRVEALADLSKKVQNNPANVDVKVDRATKDAVKKLTGIPAPQLYSTLRDRVASVHQKVFAILSKSLTAKAQEAGDEKIAQALLDPNIVAILLRQAENTVRTGNVDGSQFIRDLADAGVNLSTEVGKGTVRGGVKGLISAEEEPKVQRQQR